MTSGFSSLYSGTLRPGTHGRYRHVREKQTDGEASDAGARTGAGIHSPGFDAGRRPDELLAGVTLAGT